jgi:hypothetical protein
VSSNGRRSPPRPRIEVRQANASPEQAAAIRQAIARALEPSLREDGLHLSSVANIASGHL